MTCARARAYKQYALQSYKYVHGFMYMFIDARDGRGASLRTITG